MNGLTPSQQSPRIPAPPLERMLARTLRGGTIGISLLIAAGWLLSATRDDQRLIVAGIGGLILLPLLHVGLMAIGCLREGDRRYGAIAVCVLLIILGGIILELADVF